MNRAGLDSGQIGLKKAQETLGREIFWQIPNDYRVMVEVRNNGVPLIDHAPRSSIAQSFIGLAETFSHAASNEEQEEDRKAGGRRWLSFWSSKNSKQPVEKA